jgi:hypothetical protein
MSISTLIAEYIIQRVRDCITMDNDDSGISRLASDVLHELLSCPSEVRLIDHVLSTLIGLAIEGLRPKL